MRALTTIHFGLIMFKDEEINANIFIIVNTVFTFVSIKHNQRSYNYILNTISYQ